jgi:hypothetical protein
LTAPAGASDAPNVPSVNFAIRSSVMVEPEVRTDQDPVLGQFFYRPLSDSRLSNG